MTTIQARRQLIVLILLAVALGGAAIRHYAAAGSTLRDIGTLLMLLWIPIIGNVIAWLVARVRRPAPDEVATGFDLRREFTAHALIELTLRESQLPSENTAVSAGEHRCALVVDNQGFSARWWVRQGDTIRRGVPWSCEVEFLAPDAALGKFAVGTPFRMLIGESFVGDGRVLQTGGGAGVRASAR